MNRYFSFVLLFLASFGLKAQIQFDHLTLADAIAKAKKENKPLFVDVHATWCGPCKRMAATAFVDPKVAEYYNAHFINVKIDGEKEDGPQVMQQYGISAYPTLLYINADGTLFRKLTGMMDAAALMKRGGEAINPETSVLVQARKKYYASALEQNDLREYINVMMEDQSDSLDLFTEAYFNISKKLDMSDQLDFYVFYKHDNDINSANSIHFLENPAEYTADVYTGKIKAWINSAFSKALDQGNFAIVETMIDRVYPYWEKAEPLGQDKASYLTYVKSQYERYQQH